MKQFTTEEQSDKTTETDEAVLDQAIEELARVHARIGPCFRRAARTGSSWRELPERFGPWSTVSSRYQRWCKEGLWARILQVLLPDEAAFASSA